MKKVLSLVLVLCMAIACFAFAPTSAEIYRASLLQVTEETDTAVSGASPWGINKFGFSAWVYGKGATPDADNNAFAAPEGIITFTNEEAALYQNNYGDAKAVKIDLGANEWINNGVAAGEGQLYNDWCLQYTMDGDMLEAGKTYTFFFMGKATGCAGLNWTLKLQGNTQGTNGINFVEKAKAGALGADWALCYFTFEATEDASKSYDHMHGLGNTCAIDLQFWPGEYPDGDAIYLDGFALIEGTAADINVEEFYENYKIPLDDDDDRLNNNEDPDLDGDGILNKYDTDMDNDGTKNVWDYDIDNDKIFNGVDDKPFGGQ